MKGLNPLDIVSRIKNLYFFIYYREINKNASILEEKIYKIL